MAKKKAPEAPISNERIQAELKTLVDLGKKKGFLTHDDILEQFPEASVILKQDARVVVRRRTFPMGLPYVVYYAHLRAEPIAVVYLTHLFHERQRRPEIDLGAWPW